MENITTEMWWGAVVYTVYVVGMVWLWGTLRAPSQR